MKFIDRKPAWERLDRLPAPGLGIVWGRRRVGKTRLLVEWCKAHKGLYSAADQSSEAIQRRYLAEAIASVAPGFSQVIYPDWRALFNAVARAAEGGLLPGPLIIDEIPYLIAASPALASILQAFVDHEGREAGVQLVLAGSSQRMMHGLVLDASSPLYGRAAASFELLPLPAGFLGEALALRDAREAVKAYAAWGGIPWYWELAAPFGRDLNTAVEALVLDPAGPLHHEPDRLLAEEQPSATVLRPLLDAIGAGAHRISEIAGRVGQPSSSLTRSMARLLDLGFVRRELPFGAPLRTSKRALYRIADPFLRLWFRIVASRRGLLVAAPARTRLEVWERAQGALCASAWEDLCRGSVPLLSDSVLTRGPFEPAARYWRGNGPEWDVAARSLEGKTLLLGECKWLEKPATRPVLDRMYNELLRKGLPDTAAARELEVVHALFVPRARRSSGQRPYLTITAEDVLAASR
jgi:uncharacterized protein